MKESSSLKIKKIPKQQELNKYTMVSIGDNKFESNKIVVERLSENNYYQRIVAGKDVMETNVKVYDFEKPLYSFKAFSFLGENRNKKDVLDTFNQIINIGNLKKQEIFNFKTQQKELKTKEFEIKDFENLR